MKKNFRIISFLLISLLLISFSVCTAGATDPKQTLKIGIGTDINTFDMRRFEGTSTCNAGRRVFETLIVLDPDNLQKAIPLLATSWEQIDTTTWIFNLREGVKFTDGTPFNAAAVKFTLERASAGWKNEHQEMIEVVNIINDYQVEIKLKYPSSSFFTGLSMMPGGIISPTAVEKYGEDWFKNPVGTGQFILEEWIPGEHVSFIRNDDYWGTPAKLEKVIFYPIPNEATRVMAFKSGEIDVCEDLPAHEVAAVEADPNLGVKIQPKPRTIFIALDILSNNALRDPKVRQAIALAINTESIHKYTMEGLFPEAKNGLIPPQILKKDEVIGYGFDPERAKALLAEAGYEDGLELSIWVPEGRYPKCVEVCQVAQGQLKEVGIDLTIDIMEAATFWGRTTKLGIDKEFQMLLLGWGVGPNPYALFYALLRSDSNMNFTNYRFPNYDTRIFLADRTVDDDERNEIYSTMDKEVVENAAIIPIYYTVAISGINKKVENFSYHPLEYVLIADTSIK